MYYVLCITVYALPLGVNIVCYVLCLTYYAYYALRTGSPHRLLCITYYVLRITYYVLRIMYYAAVDPSVLYHLAATRGQLYLTSSSHRSLVTSPASSLFFLSGMGSVSAGSVQAITGAILSYSSSVSAPNLDPTLPL